MSRVCCGLWKELSASVLFTTMFKPETAERTLPPHTYRQGRTAEAVTGCDVWNVTGIVTCSNWVQGLDYLCAPVTTQEPFCQ